MGRFGEVRRTTENRVAINDHTLRMQSGFLLGSVLQRKGKIEHFREGSLLRPFVATKSLAKPLDHLRRRQHVTCRAPHIEKQTLECFYV